MSSDVAVLVPLIILGVTLIGIIVIAFREPGERP